MLLIRCPYCEEERPELEFRNAGEAHIARSTDIASISDDDFEKFFFIRSNPKGIIFERWRHVHGCARFFNAARDTVTDKFLAVYKAGEPKPDLAKLASSDPAAYANRPPDQLNVKKTDVNKPARRAPAKKKDA
ncbi:sarcosine oxidase subunit delta [Mesorhizobium sp. KR9-304]|uniref:sarcosine oxidase subunit delta n=1 Tax=Mesorhizobium sp. KR9-304 TaxID=3156614 RepID=UPI0032B3870C